MKYIKTIVVVFFVIFLNVMDSNACDCKSKTIDESILSSDLIVFGKVIKKEMSYYVLSKQQKDSIEQATSRKLFNDTITYFEYTIKVKRSFKSSTSVNQIVIRSGARNSNCDFHFEENKKYVIYAYSKSLFEDFFYPRTSNLNTFYTSQCTRTTCEIRSEKNLLKGQNL
ncbi:MAG: hypothetical protein RI922_1751 [Bacteroidota bacterium]|jgi:hypothetical protein